MGEGRRFGPRRECACGEPYEICSPRVPEQPRITYLPKG